MNEETERRLSIALSLVERVKDCTDAALVGGSVGFQNANAKSDIDMPLLLKPEFVRHAVFGLELSAPEEALHAFEARTIDGLFLTKKVSGVEVNCFLYNFEPYEQFVTAQKGMQMFIQTRPSPVCPDYLFDGRRAEVPRTITPLGTGFVYDRKVLADGEWYMGAVRQDHFCCGMFLYDKNERLPALRASAWRSAIASLVGKYGKDVDLKKYNILNTHWVYQTARERLPENVILAIKKKSELQLEDYLKSL
jgi:hypothetical protein